MSRVSFLPADHAPGPSGFAFRLLCREVIASLPFGSTRSEGYSLFIETARLALRQGWRRGEVPIAFEN